MGEGDAHFAKNHFDRSPAGNLYTIAWNRGREQRMYVDGVQVNLPAESIVALMLNESFWFDRPADVVYWQFDREFYCIFDHDAEVGCAGLLFYGPVKNAVLLPDQRFAEMLTALLQVFKDEFEDRDDIQGPMLRMLLVRLIVKVTRLARNQLRETLPEDEGFFSLLRRFRMLVEQNYRKEHLVKFYAEQLNKSPKTLSNIFRQLKSESPLAIIQTRLADEACRLLLFTDRSAKEIAAELGFDDAGHFSRFFKNQTGKSPTAFRESRKST